MLFPKRIWRDIEGYPNYQVSNDGKVRNLNYARSGQKKILKQKTYKGYKRVDLYKEGKKKTFLVHRLVASAFVLNSNNYPCVNHKDENKANNHASNLEWCTHKYNNNYGNHSKKIVAKRKAKDNYKHTEEAKIKISEARKGKDVGAKNPRARKIQCINNNMVFDCLLEACNWCGLKGSSSIAKQIQDKYSYAGKDPLTKEPLKWRYID